MPINSTQELLLHELHAIHDAENQASNAIETMAREARTNGLQRLLEQRMEQGRRVIDDVESGIETLGGKGRGARNDAARGLIEEAQKMMREAGSPELKEVVAIAGVQKLEHYCIAAWGTVKAMAGAMDARELTQAMDRAITEGRKLDEEMTRLAESEVNPAAIKAEKGDQSAESGGSENRGGSSRSDGSSQASGGDLKSREYRDEDGNIHHHTKKYMDEHKN